MHDKMKGTKPMEIRELKGDVYDLPDIECGNILKELQRAASASAIEKAAIIIVEGYLVKNRHNTLRSTQAVLVDYSDSQTYLVVVGGQRIEGFVPDTLYMTQDLMEKVQKQIDTSVRNADKMYTELLEVIKPYMWDTCGYSQESTSFDIVLAVKEIIRNLRLEGAASNFYFPMYNAEGFKHDLQEKYKSTVSDGLAATVLWCAITSALARKYKQMPETDGAGALEELVELANTLDEHDFIHRVDIERVL